MSPFHPVHYHTIEVDGLDIFYREAGPADAPVLLLLHGFPTSSFMYRHLLAGLGDRYRVIAPDYPGFGYSSFPAPADFAYTFDRLSEVLEGFVDALGLSRFSLYVQDYGAPVGLRLVTRRPALLQCLIVQNANAYPVGIGPIFEPIMATWTDPSPAKKQKVMELFELPVTHFQYENGASDRTRISPDTYTLDQSLLDRPGNKEAQFQLQYDYRNNPPQYPAWHKMFRQVQPPTLVVWGENDPFFTKEGALAYAQDLPVIEYHFYPGGHFVLEEFHEDITARIGDFLGRHLLRP